jgi:hypothetical protein
MAQIVVSGDELVGILTANGAIPDDVMDIQTEGEEIKIRVKTPWPILTSVRVTMRFAGFEQGQAILRLVTNRLIDRFDWLVDRMLGSFSLANHCARWEYPRLSIDVNALLQRQVRGIWITDIMFEDGHYRITTTHTTEACRWRDPETLGEPEPPSSTPNLI